jgi:phosphoribosylaminoimidazolecarboxamide formyltransferase/IMP cyclohydrolase
MSEYKKIESALISVFYKDGLEELVRELNRQNVRIYSTGGTLTFIRELGIEAISIEEITHFPEILGGRVKTLHPGVFGGILHRRNNPSDVETIKKHNISAIDLVVVDLYPFEESVQLKLKEEEIIEKIDIGGISLIRAAAKNFEDVTVIASRNHYDHFTTLFHEQEGKLSLEQRRLFAAEAFNMSSHYDSMIYSYFSADPFDNFKQSVQQKTVLRYGENPHQKGVFFGDMNLFFDKLYGKELSFNNILDIDAAVNLMSEFTKEGPTFAILKHNNPCGVATADTTELAFSKALAADPLSAFGGVLISNQLIDINTATKINDLFFEVLIAPAYDEDALVLLKSKKNRVLLIQKTNVFPKTQFRTALNGILQQERDEISVSEEMLEVKTILQPTNQELKDLIFANKIAKHTKSNTIVLAKNLTLIASGTGQTSRVDALSQAIHKAAHFGFDLTGASMASDAFFPFPDCVEIAFKSGVTSVIHPGGSIKDSLSIDFCDQNKMTMVFSGIRHFKH